MQSLSRQRRWRGAANPAGDAACTARSRRTRPAASLGRIVLRRQARLEITGMPAWPAQQRDDEVWAMTAFLRRLPQLDADEYQRLTRGTTTDALWDLPDADLANTSPVVVRETC